MRLALIETSSVVNEHVIITYKSVFIAAVTIHMMDEAIPGPSQPRRAKTGEKRKWSYPCTDEELYHMLCDSDDDFNDLTFSLSDEEKTSGWYDSDDDDEEMNAVTEIVTDDNQLEYVHPDDVNTHSQLTKSKKSKIPIVTWSENPPNTPTQINFVRQQELLQLPEGDSPMDYFNLLVDDSFYELVTCETNIYATEVFLSHGTKEHSRISRWKDITHDEIKIFFALLIHMGTISLNHVQDYWKRDPLFSIPIFSASMSRDRFFLIFRCLHFSTNPGPNDPQPTDRLFKIRPVVNYFNNKMQQIYYPGRHLSLDESMVLWRGRLLFRQYIKNKRHRYGIKLYSLTEPNGIIQKFSVYTGSLDDQGGQGHTSKVVMNLMEEKLDTGHSLFMDNYYNSYDLALHLLERQTLCTGTLNIRRKNLPDDVKNAKLTRGETIARYANDVMVAKWKDNRDVLYISTEFDNNIVEYENRRKRVLHKPRAILEYNQHMGGIDKTDQMMSYYPFERKTLRWYKKLGIHIFHMLLINAYFIFKKYSGNSRMSLYDFRLHVIREMLPSTRVSRQVFSPRGNIEHILEKNSQTQARKVAHRRCVICYKKNIRKETAYCCATCPKKPALCATGTCFSDFHKNL